MLLYDVNKSDSSVNELRYRTFTQKNLRGDRLPPTFDALVLHLRRALIFFHQYFFYTFSELSFFNIKNIKYNIEKTFSILFT